MEVILITIKQGLGIAVEEGGMWCGMPHHKYPLTTAIPQKP
jgi:hypothetical protein